MHPWYHALQSPLDSCEYIRGYNHSCIRTNVPPIVFAQHSIQHSGWRHSRMSIENDRSNIRPIVWTNVICEYIRIFFGVDCRQGLRARRRTAQAGGRPSLRARCGHVCPLIRGWSWRRRCSAACARSLRAAGVARERARAKGESYTCGWDQDAWQQSKHGMRAEPARTAAR